MTPDGSVSYITKQKLCRQASYIIQCVCVCGKALSDRTIHLAQTHYMDYLFTNFLTSDEVPWSIMRI